MAENETQMGLINHHIMGYPIKISEPGITKTSVISVVFDRLSACHISLAILTFRSKNLNY